MNAPCNDGLNYVKSLLLDYEESYGMYTGSHMHVQTIVLFTTIGRQNHMLTLSYLFNAAYTQSKHAVTFTPDVFLFCRYASVVPSLIL